MEKFLQGTYATTTWYWTKDTLFGTGKDALYIGRYIRNMNYEHEPGMLFLKMDPVFFQNITGDSDLAEEGEIRLEEEELSLAEWVDYRDVPDDPEGLSLTREMKTYFRKQREQGLNP